MADTVLFPEVNKLITIFPIEFRVSIKTFCVKKIHVPTFMMINQTVSEFINYIYTRYLLLYVRNEIESHLIFLVVLTTIE